MFSVIVYDFLFEKEMLNATKNFASINAVQQIYQQALKYFADTVIQFSIPVKML